MHARLSGEGGIRTPETLASLPVFETGTFNRSATSPWFATRKDYHLFAFFTKNVIVSCVFRILFLILFCVWPYRLTVRTRPFQGCNRGSIPRRVTKLSVRDFVISKHKSLCVLEESKDGLSEGEGVGVEQIFSRKLCVTESEAIPCRVTMDSLFSL